MTMYLKYSNRLLFVKNKSTRPPVLGLAYGGPRIEVIFIPAPPSGMNHHRRPWQLRKWEKCDFYHGRKMSQITNKDRFVNWKNILLPW